MRLYPPGRVELLEAQVRKRRHEDRNHNKVPDARLGSVGCEEKHRNHPHADDCVAGMDPSRDRRLTVVRVSLRNLQAHSLKHFYCRN